MSMTFDELKTKAHSLPMAPGVYIMRDKQNKVIYVGKAKKLRNRVSQYFLDSDSHSRKTRLMVSNINEFDVIVASSEFEALILECAQIKQYMPKYNILLKDDKGFPYIRLDIKSPYPCLQLSSKISKDGALYFGPYGSRSTTQGIVDILLTTLKLPKCKKVFPRDIGKDRPCLNYHMNQCTGWCMESCSSDAYRECIEQARQLLSGNYKQVASEIRSQMISAADQMNFELAAMLRDRLIAVESLGQKQLVTALHRADTDVIGFDQTETKACFSVLHYSMGNLLEKEYDIISFQENKEEALSSLVKQYYISRETFPQYIYYPFHFEDEELLETLFAEKAGHAVRLVVPERGDKRKLVTIACQNALEEAQRVTGYDEKTAAILELLGKMLVISPLKRIESYDISNISGTDIVSAMVVFVNGKASKKDYKRFKIKELTDQDDYASMRQTLFRRFERLKNGDEGFSEQPDLLLIDGGVGHAKVAAEILKLFDLAVPIFGMVKDSRHRTRALVSPDGMEISIDCNQSVFSFIGNIQEETHRFAISYHRKLRSKRLRYSELDSIPGIGAKRKQDLLRHFGSLREISSATVPELERILPKDAAMSVYKHYH